MRPSVRSVSCSAMVGREREGRGRGAQERFCSSACCRYLRFRSRVMINRKLLKNRPGTEVSLTPAEEALLVDFGYHVRRAIIRPMFSEVLPPWGYVGMRSNWMSDGRKVRREIHFVRSRPSAARAIQATCMLDPTAGWPRSSQRSSRTVLRRSRSFAACRWSICHGRSSTGSNPWRRLELRVLLASSKAAYNARRKSLGLPKKTWETKAAS